MAHTKRHMKRASRRHRRSARRTMRRHRRTHRRHSRRHMRGGMVNLALSPAPFDGQGVGTSGVDVQFRAGLGN